MSAVKSGNHIYVSGSGNTLESIAADINDTSFCEWNSTTKTLTIKSVGVARYLRIRNGGTLTIGDSTDYSVSETLEFNGNTANYLRFYVDTGGRLEQYGNTKIDFMVGSQRTYYCYIYGALYIRGNATYKPIWQNYQRIYLYENQNNDTYSNDIWDIDGMIIGSACIANYYAFYFNSMGKVRNHSFKNITFDKTYGKGYAMYALRFPYDIRGIRNITFENLNFENVGNYPLYCTYSRPHLKGCDFGTTTSWKVLIYGTGLSASDNTHWDFDYHNEHVDGQHFVYLEDCTFRNENNKACLVSQYNGCVLVKDCTWEHDTSDSVQAAYGGIVMMWTGNTFGSREYYDIDYDGRVQWVYGLTLTINDKNGNPVGDATITIEQNEGKERYTFHTDSNGKIRNDHNLDCALLTWKHQYYNSKTTNIELWSDTTNSTYHTITVMKEGYKTISEEYVMSSDKSDTIILKPSGKNSINKNFSKSISI